MNIEGIIPILGGIYGYFLATGYLPKKPKEPEKMEIWRNKFGGFMKKACPFLVVFGLLQLLGFIPSSI